MGEQREGSSSWGFSGINLRGLTFRGRLANGEAVDLRIDGLKLVFPLHLAFYFSVRGEGEAWAPLCHDRAAAYVLPGGRDTETGVDHNRFWRPQDGISFACLGSSAAKCVELGYDPRLPVPLMNDLHRTCVRMLRADYCGDGRSFTEDGVVVAFADFLRIQTDVDGRREAAWGPDGAHCIERTRAPVGNEACIEARVRDRCSGRGALMTSSIPETAAPSRGAGGGLLRRLLGGR